MGWVGRAGRAILEGKVDQDPQEIDPPEKVEVHAMHDALASLLLMAVMVFPCFVSLETRS